MNIKIVTAPRGLAFDASTYVNPTVARLMWSLGYRTVFRYIRTDEYVTDHPDTSWPVSCSFQERDELLDVGFGLGLVQFALNQFTPNRENGLKCGRAAAFNAKALGGKDGLSVFCDIEYSQVPAESPVGVINLIEGWAEPVNENAILDSGMYGGANVGLTGDQLYGLKGIHHYWKAGSVVPSVSKRGYQIVQGLETTLTYPFVRAKGASLEAFTFDPDMICLDAFGDGVKVMVKG